MAHVIMTHSERISVGGFLWLQKAHKLNNAIKSLAPVTRVGLSELDLVSVLNDHTWVPIKVLT